LQEDIMEFGTIEREIYVEAAPAIVFDVVSKPEHLREWWPDDARYDVVPGSDGEIRFGDNRVAFTVLEVQPPHTFTFRWTHEAGQAAAEGNSLLVTFELTPSGPGTLVRMTETGFREMGWEVAVLEEQYRDHVSGWDHFLARLSPYATTLAARP
jgi:uncharacterized protein YndB with AHSA1/START domain